MRGLQVRALHTGACCADAACSWHIPLPSITAQPHAMNMYTFQPCTAVESHKSSRHIFFTCFILSLHVCLRPPVPCLPCCTSSF